MSLVRLSGYVVSACALVFGCSSTKADVASGSAGTSAVDSGIDESRGGSLAEGKTIVLADNSWDAAHIDATIAKILISERIGDTVILKEGPQPQQWDMLESGEITAFMEVWTSLNKPKWDTYVKTGRVEDGGPLGPKAKVGWFIPTYMLKDHPELATWAGFVKKDHPDVAALFHRAPASGGKGLFWSGDRGWTQYDQHIMNNLGIDFEVHYPETNDEAGQLRELDAAYTKSLPFIMYFWYPHAALAKYDLTNVELPPYSDECYAQAKDRPETVRCDYQVEVLGKAFTKSLRTEAPRAYKFLKAFQLSTKEQITLLGKMESEGLTIEQVSRWWIDNNQTTWETWIPAN